MWYSKYIQRKGCARTNVPWMWATRRGRRDVPMGGADLRAWQGSFDRRSSGLGQRRTEPIDNDLEALRKVGDGQLAVGYSLEHQTIYQACDDLNGDRPG